MGMRTWAHSGAGSQGPRVAAPESEEEDSARRGMFARRGGGETCRLENDRFRMSRNCGLLGTETKGCHSGIRGPTFLELRAGRQHFATKRPCASILCGAFRQHPTLQTSDRPCALPGAARQGQGGGTPSLLSFGRRPLLWGLLHLGPQLRGSRISGVDGEWSDKWPGVRRGDRPKFGRSRARRARSVHGARCHRHHAMRRR